MEALDSIASAVLKEYGIVPENIAVIQSGTIKTVWKLRTSGRTLCLKRLKQTIDKAQFSVNAQIHIKNAGGLVPGIVKSARGQPIVEYNGQLFVLYEWINGADINFGNKADQKLAVQGLARFHIASRNYKPDEVSRVSTKLGKWPEQYRSMKDRMTAWKQIAQSNGSQQGYAAYLKFTDPVLSIAESALAHIAGSGYAELTRDGSGSIVLCHQDYGKGNAIATPSGIYVLDLDGVTFDLPARDLRKIIGKLAENKGQWQLSSINEITGWYSEINPLSANEKEVLYIDLLYPHWYFGLVKNLFQNNKQLKASEIERAARLEESKLSVLNALLKRSENN